MPRRTKSKDDYRSKFMKFRVNPREMDLLNELQRKTGMTKTQLMIRGLKMQYNLCKYHADSFFALPKKVQLMEKETDDEVDK